MSRRPKKPTVHPRLVWGGLVIAVAGAVILSAGIMADSILISVLGVVVLLVGVGISVRGGVMYDARSAMAPTEELRHVVTGDELPGTVPGEMYDDPRASRTARELAVGTARLERRAETWPRPSLQAPAAVVMLLLGGTLGLMRWHLLNHDDDGLDSYLHTAAAVLLLLSGLRCLTARGPHRIPGAAGALAGIGLVLEALLAGHAHTGLGVTELILGGAAALAGAAVVRAGGRT